METGKNKIDFDEVARTSDCFIHFLGVAEDMARRIKDDERNFFEGEEEFKAVLESFQTQNIITESEYYDLLGKPFENSIHTLLKTLYFNGYFSGDINRVERVKDILKSLAEHIEPHEIGEICSYYKTRYDALIQKEIKSLILPYVRGILDIMIEPDGDIWNENQNLVWELIDITSKFDSSGHIVRLYGMGNNPYLAAYECLHFLLINDFLAEDNKVEVRTYNYLKEIYQKNKISERLSELDQHKSKLKDTGNIQIDGKIGGILSKDIYEERLKKVILKDSKKLYESAKFGKHDIHSANQLKNLINFLHGEGIIDYPEYKVAIDVLFDVTSVFYILSLLSSRGFFDSDILFKNNLKESDALYDEMLGEQDFISMDTISPENMRDTIENFTTMAITLIEAECKQELEDILYSFIDFLIDNSIIQEHLPAENAYDASIKYMKMLEDSGYYSSSPDSLKSLQDFLSTYNYE